MPRGGGMASKPKKGRPKRSGRKGTGKKTKKTKRRTPKETTKRGLKKGRKKEKKKMGTARKEERKTIQAVPPQKQGAVPLPKTVPSSKQEPRINIRCRACFRVDGYLKSEKKCHHCGAEILEIDAI